jgi:hypothetical protein
MSDELYFGFILGGGLNKEGACAGHYEAIGEGLGGGFGEVFGGGYGWTSVRAELPTRRAEFLFETDAAPLRNAASIQPTLKAAAESIYARSRQEGQGVGEVPNVWDEGHLEACRKVAVGRGPLFQVSSSTHRGQISRRVKALFS